MRRVTQSSLRRAIGIVQQDVFLFAGTIRDNIAYGRLGATEEEIVEAARQARLDTVIAALPDGLDTVIGEPPEIYPFLGSSRLAETIDRFDVSAVVHGHAHRGAYQGRTPRGTPVYNVAAHIEKPTGRPYALLEI